VHCSCSDATTPQRSLKLGARQLELGGEPSGGFERRALCDDSPFRPIRPGQCAVGAGRRD
jgi:hypothetical protein